MQHLALSVDTHELCTRRRHVTSIASRALLLAGVVGVVSVGCGDDEATVDAATGAGVGGANSTSSSSGGNGTGGASTGGVGGEAGGAGGTGPELLGPPYPVVLAHGFFGFEEFAGVDFATYFFEVADNLAANGEPMVFTPAVDPFNSSEFRGAQLQAHIEAIVAQTGHAKVNIIGHSQGGLDARFVAHMRPDLVASVVTVATPHHGSPVSDIVLQIIDDPALSSLLNWVVQVVGAPLYDEVGNETDVVLALAQFSTPGVAAFNREITDQPGVFYASVTGRTGYHLGGADCQPDVDLPFVSRFATEVDPTDALLGVTEPILDGGAFENIPNDGLVRVADAKWGQFWGRVPADHLDEVGQLFGDKPGLLNGWSHQDFYTDIIAHLRALGY